MICPKCKSFNDEVLDSNRTEDGWTIRRRRLCKDCSFRFTTYERMEQNIPRIVDNNAFGYKFSRERVLNALTKACSKLGIGLSTLMTAAVEIEHRVMADGRREIPANELGRWITEKLGQINEVARIRYELEWRRPQDIDGCMEIMFDYMRRLVAR